jgi:hypothetical protein
MSSTKIVIIVLILVAVIFVIFVARGAFRNDPKSDDPKLAAKNSSKKGGKPGWTKAINDFVGSRQPKLTLKQSRYTANTTEEVRADEKNPFRIAKFRLISGSATIEYEDRTEEAEKMKLDDQDFDLPNFDNEEDPRSGSIVALEKGGTLTITCKGTGGCRVDVVK